MIKGFHKVSYKATAKVALSFVIAAFVIFTNHFQAKAFNADNIRQTTTDKDSAPGEGTGGYQQNNREYQGWKSLR